MGRRIGLYCGPEPDPAGRPAHRITVTAKSTFTRSATRRLGATARRLSCSASKACRAQGPASEGGMRVLLLGAGASKPAGYPLAWELISANAELLEGERQGIARPVWNAWGSPRHNAEGTERELL